MSEVCLIIECPNSIQIAALVTIPKVFSKENKERTWARAFGDSAMRTLIDAGWNIQQMVYVMGSTTTLYEKWAQQAKLEVLSDEIGEGAQFHWIGPRKYKRVFLFLHGELSLCVNLPGHYNLTYT